MEKKELRLGVIGCGRMTLNAHLQSFKKLENCKITCFCDVDIEAAKKAQKDYGAEYVFENYEDMLPYVDAVFVVLPHAFHYPCGKFFLEHGKHVLMEKPLANTEEECMELIELSEKKKRISWQEGAAAGSMVVRLSDGRRYRIERATTATTGTLFIRTSIPRDSGKNEVVPHGEYLASGYIQRTSPRSITLRMDLTR